MSDIFDKKEVKLILRLFKAFERDWAVVDNADEEEHMVLVNQDRMEHKTLHPSKLFINKLERYSLIKQDSIRTSKNTTHREFREMFGESMPIPFVYFYEITSEGKEFSEKHKKS